MNCVLYLSKKSVLPIYGIAVWWTADTLTLKQCFLTSYKKFSLLVHIPVKRRLAIDQGTCAHCSSFEYGLVYLRERFYV